MKNGEGMDYYEPRVRIANRVTETVGSVLAAPLIVAGVYLSRRYKEVVMGRMQEVVRTGKELDLADRFVMATLPNRDKNRVLFSNGKI